MLYNVAHYTVCPTRYRAGWLADRCSVSQELGALQAHTTDTFLFISLTPKRTPVQISLQYLHWC